MNLLHIDSSILGENSASKKLSGELVAAELKKNPETQVTYRDLGTHSLPHLSGLHLAAMQAGEVQHSAELAADLAESEKVLEEFLAADVVVLGVPMYNFGIPSQLKAWIDRICVAGRTFKYGANGPEGLVGGKKLIILSARGGFYTDDSGLGFLDHQENHLKGVFGFLGITDIHIVRAEGLGTGPEQREKAMNAAKAELEALV